MKNLVKTIAYICIIPLLISLYFFDNIRGYYRFKELCDIEKTKQIVGKVEPNQGWILDYKNGESASKWTAFDIASLPHVKFVRFKQIRDNEMHDARYLGGHKDSKNSYEIKPVDLTQHPRYLWREIDENFPNELRTGRSGNQIIDLSTNKIVVSFTHIYFGTFDQDKTLLAAPSANVCSWYSPYKPLDTLFIFGN